MAERSKEVVKVQVGQYEMDVLVVNGDDGEVNLVEEVVKKEVPPSIYKAILFRELSEAKYAGLVHNAQSDVLRLIIELATNLSAIEGLRVRYYYNAELGEFHLGQELKQIGFVKENVLPDGEIPEGYEEISEQDFQTMTNDMVVQYSAYAETIMVRLANAESSLDAIFAAEERGDADVGIFYEAWLHNSLRVGVRRMGEHDGDDEDDDYDEEDEEGDQFIIISKPKKKLGFI